MVAKLPGGVGGQHDIVSQTLSQKLSENLLYVHEL